MHAAPSWYLSIIHQLGIDVELALEAYHLGEAVEAPARPRFTKSGRIVEAEGFGAGVVSESFGEARPSDHRPQGLLDGFLGHVVLELVAEASARRRVIDALLQHSPDVSSDRNMRQQLALE